MAGRDELTDKAWEKKREVSVNLTAAPAHQHAVSARHRPSKASAKSGSSTRTTRPSDAAEGESSEASSSTRQDAVPGPEGLALSASFGSPEGMALLDMSSRITDEVTVHTIGTGFLFDATTEFREEVMRRYRLPLEVLRPIRPLKKAMERYGAWMTGIRREQASQRANTPVVSWDSRLGAAKIASFAFAKEEWVHGYVAEYDAPINPLLKKGYESIGASRRPAPWRPTRRTTGRWSGTEEAECGLYGVGG
jgi:phosphoadenosine phosphosulfate reductase